MVVASTRIGVSLPPPLHRPSTARFHRKQLWGPRLLLVQASSPSTPSRLLVDFSKHVSSQGCVKTPRLRSPEQADSILAILFPESSEDSATERASPAVI